MLSFRHLAFSETHRHKESRGLTAPALQPVSKGDHSYYGCCPGGLWPEGFSANVSMAFPLGSSCCPGGWLPPGFSVTVVILANPMLAVTASIAVITSASISTVSVRFTPFTSFALFPMSLVAYCLGLEKGSIVRPLLSFVLA